MPRGATDPKKLMDKSQVLKLKLRLEQEQEIMFSIDKGYVNIDVPKLPAQRYFVDAGEMWKRWDRPEFSLEAPLGEDRYGEIISINFSDTLSPHILVGGTTGSGKSEVLNVLLYGLVRIYSPAELRLLLVDPKGTELQDFTRTPHLLGEIGWGDAEALELLKHAVIEMQSRYEKMREEKARTIAEFNTKVSADKRLPWWVVVLDEYADLTSEQGMKKEIENELKRLAQKARAAGIHVVIATQKPSVDVISTVLRSNLPAQIALRVKSATESRVVMDESGAEMLNGKGDAYLKLGSALTRVQCALVSKSDLESILSKFS
jgi:DNA phosphorothioation-dependent restriction protein DptH